MKDIFTYNIDVNKTAYMNWRTHKHDAIGNMITIAEGYYQSSIKLGESLLKDNSHKEADIIIFPMLFSVNHSIELYLKVIMWEFNIILKKSKKFEKHHNIKQLYYDVQARMKEFESDKDKRKKFNELTNGLNCYIFELFTEIKIDNDIRKDCMDFSRYPFNTDFENHFYLNNYENKVVDLENFILRFKEIGQNLDTIAKHYLYEYIDYQGEG